MNEQLSELLACPRCGGALNPAELACNGCGQQFFDLQGMPCLFPNGLQQRDYWAHLTAVLAEEAAQPSASNDVFGVGLPPASGERLARLSAAQLASKQAIVERLTAAGIEPRRDDTRFGSFSPQSLLQYFPLLLRDWAWPPAVALEQGWEENRAALEGVMAALPEAGLAGQRVLVLGSGAGRLGWDIHCAARPELTLALDFNPLLGFAAHSLIRDGAAWPLPDAQLQPSQGLPQLQIYTARAEEGSAERRASFHQICADAFNAPLAPASFDWLITPWFVDICGRDARQTIAMAARLLRPGGQWLNYGPLLYPDSLPNELHYTPAEWRELLALAGFALQWEREQDHLYLQSPLARRGRWERSWLWRAQAPMADAAEATRAQPITTRIPRGMLPPWWVLPHLPVPPVSATLLPPELQNLAQLFDGQRSLSELAQQLSALLPAGQDALQFLRELLLAYVFEPGSE